VIVAVGWFSSEEVDGIRVKIYLEEMIIKTNLRVIHLVTG